MKKIFTLAAIAAAASLSGCAAGPSVVSGFWYTNQSGPIAVTGTTGASKVGVSRANSILGLVGTGDASISAAMANGGITKVQHVDFHTKSILGIIADTEVMVYGE